MEISILAAKILGVVYLSAGLGALSGKLDFNKMIDEFESSPALCYLAGIITLILGMFLVEYHNVWVMNWRVLITLVGWLALFKGIALMAFPRWMVCFKGGFKNTKLLGLLVLGLGLMFSYFGFMA